MQNIFFFILALLFLTGCSEENTKTSNNDEQSYIVIKKTIENQGDNNPEDPITIKEELLVKEQEEISPAESTPDQQEPKAIISMVTFNINPNDMVLGNKDAKTILVEYFSPTCPHCAYYKAQIFPKIKTKYIDTNKIAYVMREFIATKQDLDAAILARCANNVDSFLQFHSIMLQQQDSWAYSDKYRDLLTNIGQIGGVSPENYQKCLKDDKIAEILIANTTFVSKSPRFIGTPAFFINGVQLDKGYSTDNLSKALDASIEAKNE